MQNDTHLKILSAHVRIHKPTKFSWIQSGSYKNSIITVGASRCRLTKVVQMCTANSLFALISI